MKTFYILFLVSVAGRSGDIFIFYLTIDVFYALVWGKDLKMTSIPLYIGTTCFYVKWPALLFYSLTHLTRAALVGPISRKFLGKYTILERSLTTFGCSAFYHAEQSNCSTLPHHDYLQEHLCNRHSPDAIL